MSFQLYKSLKTLGANNPLAIQFEYLLNSGREKKVEWNASSGSKLRGVWTRGQDLRELLSAFVDSKWDNMDLGDPKTIVDLGSNTGYSALYFASRFPQSKVFLVDLLQANTIFSRRLFQVNDKTGVHVAGAIAREDGLVDVDIHPAHSRNRLSELLDDDQRRTFGFTDRKIAVPAMRLSTLARYLGLSKIDLLKVDIEGAEQLLIEDIDDWHPLVQTIVMELHHNVDKSFALNELKRVGYHVDTSGIDWLIRRK
jgi:FkbM family methyltransferase